ncbi:MFS transporter [Priestia aryabhattai]|uniref:MFS transporter n=1 Tax=Priestia megaterium TaxID=1404 RepID=UPI0039B8C345
MHFRNFIFIIVLALTLCGEGMLTVTLTWTILDEGGSVAQLGGILCIMSVLPFLMQKYSSDLRKLITNSPLSVFSICRSIGIAVVVYSLINSDSLSLNSLYIFAGIFSIILFLSTQSLETFMSQLVLEGKMPSKKASNLLQTSIQIGAFGGNAIAGFMLNLGGFTYVLYALLLSLSIGISIPFFTKKLNEEGEEGNNDSKRKSHDIQNQKLKNNSFVLTLSIIAVGILTIQLSAFNFLIPIIFHDVHQWEPSQYGIVSSAAGVGALIATLIGKFEKYIPARIFILIAFIDLGLGFINSWYIAIFCALCLGFVFNRSRIFQRQVMFDHIYRKEETSIWTSRSTVVLQVTKAASPLVLAFPIGWFGTIHSSALLGSIGVIVVISLSIIYLYQRKNSKITEEKIEILKNV